MTWADSNGTVILVLIDPNTGNASLASVTSDSTFEAWVTTTTPGTISVTANTVTFSNTAFVGSGGTLTGNGVLNRQ